jgi:hypothetical protein
MLLDLVGGDQLGHPTVFERGSELTLQNLLDSSLASAAPNAAEVAGRFLGSNAAEPAFYIR